MINFGISAPGKVILFGEHAVVHGKTAIAVSLGQRASLEFSELPSQESYVYIELPKVRVSEKFAVEELRRGLKDLPDINHGHDKFLEYVKQLVKIDVKDSAKVSIECFLYALFQVAQGELLEIKPFKLKLDSELSIGAGTGSSASYSVCLNAAFLRWSQLQKNFSAPPEFNKVSLEKISKYAFNCEKIMHGSPSGIDNSICTFGSVIQFRKGEPPKFVSLGSRSLRILLVDTRVGRNTKVMVARLAELLRKFPTIFNKVLECIDEVSLSSVHIFKRLQALDGLADKQIENEKAKLLFEELSALIDINQGLLTTCQASHPSLDSICASAKKYGFSAKLTGAGGGGYAYVLIPPGSSKDKINLLFQELTDNGFTVTETIVGGAGVTIHDEK